MSSIVITEKRRRGPTFAKLFSIVATLLWSAVLTLPAAATKKMPSIEKGSNVSIDYTLTVDGKIVDSSVGKKPLPYVAGSGQIVPGLDEQLMGSKKGDKKKITVEPEKGYGNINPNAIQIVPRSNFGDMKGLKLGAIVRGRAGNQPVEAKVTNIDDKYVTLDMNHPLAGKTLVFDIDVVDVQPGKISDSIK